MKPLSPDTTPDAQRKQYELMRQLSPEQKLSLAFALTDATRKLVLADLHHRFPYADADEIKRRFIARVLSRDDVIRAYGFDPKRKVSESLMDVPISVLSQVTAILEEQGIRYVLVGSFASSIHGMYRSTADIDLVAEIKPEQVRPLFEALRNDFYVDEQVMQDAVVQRSSFNAIHFDSVFKVDFFLPKTDSFGMAELDRRQFRKLSPDRDEAVYVATAEDTVLAKLRWYRAGHEISSNQWNDVVGILGTSFDTLDLDYLRTWAEELSLADLLEKALSDVREDRHMKIDIIGGGPAGLYFAILMKKADVAHQIKIYERNGPDDTFGWGVVFSGKTLANLRAADEESHAEITKQFEAWDNVDVVHRTSKISIHGNSFSGIARLRLLKILQRRAEELGVEIEFRSEIQDVESLRNDCDLLLAADGVNSTVRLRYAEQFQPELDVRSNRYIWYGTNQLFHGLTLTFRENESGVFAAHSYKFNSSTSTFIVECDPDTWEHAGFANLSEEQAREYLGQVFSDDLNGHQLLSNNSKWINFLLVKNKNWFFENVVLIGDALHTAHFSIGSGTKLAIEDSIALAEAFQGSASVNEALTNFTSKRRPVIQDYQSAAYESMIWFENAARYMHLGPVELAYSLMTRSGRVSYEDLKRRDPEFIRQYESV